MSSDGLTRSQRTMLKQVRKDLADAMTHPPTRRLIMRLIDSTHVFRPVRGEFNDGRRSIGLELIDQIEDNKPGDFARLQLEAVQLQQQQESKTREDTSEDQL